MNFFLIFVFLTLSVYIILNVFAFFKNCMFFFLSEEDISNSKILIIGAHQDDEISMAGELMNKQMKRELINEQMKKSKDVKIIITTNGVKRNSPNFKQRSNIRKNETIKVLEQLNIKKESISFFDFFVEDDLKVEKNIKICAKQLFNSIQAIKPDLIIIPAFEGGHPDHDITNYITYRITKKINSSNIKLLETPLYNNYFFSDIFFSKINKFLYIKYKVFPRFIPNGIQSFILPKEDNDFLEKKKELLSMYKSQRPDELIEKFGYRDQFRKFKKHNYSSGPFNQKKNIRFLLLKLITFNKKKKYF